MDACQHCKGSRILRIGAKCSDLFNMSFNGKEYNGYVPQGVHVANDGDYDEDYIEMQICMDCGRVQGKFPVSDTAINKAFKKGTQDG